MRAVHAPCSSFAVAKAPLQAGPHNLHSAMEHATNAQLPVCRAGDGLRCCQAELDLGSMPSGSDGPILPAQQTPMRDRCALGPQTSDNQATI